MEAVHFSETSVITVNILFQNAENFSYSIPFLFLLSVLPFSSLFALDYFSLVLYFFYEIRIFVTFLIFVSVSQPRDCLLDDINIILRF